jgi:hypothetical protein
MINKRETMTNKKKWARNKDKKERRRRRRREGKNSLSFISTFVDRR